MATKLPTLETFMTEKDEADFSALLKEQIPDVRFIDSYAWARPEPPVHDSLADCHGDPYSHAIIINTSILELETYRRNYVGKPVAEREEYDGAPVGPGLIQFLRSRQAGYLPDGLRNGRLAASYDPETDPATDAFVKAVWKLCRKHGKKLYGIDPKTGHYITDKPLSRFIAWPDAIARYDQVDGLFLSNNTMCYLTSKR